MDFLSDDYKTAVELVGNRWQKLDGANIFLTGGTGFFGLWLVNTFVAASKSGLFRGNMTILSRNPSRFLAAYPGIKEEKNISFVLGDVRTFEFPKGDFSHVIHGAVDVAPALSSQDLETFDVLYSGARRVLEFCQEKNVASALFISSGAVYGQKSAFVREDLSEPCHPVVPNSFYAEGKRIAEKLFLSSLISERVKVARCFAFIGPHLSLSAPLAAAHFFRDVLAGNDIVLKSDGSSLRSYMYGTDLASWLWTLLLDNSDHKIFNVGSPESISILDFAKKIAMVSGKNITVRAKTEKNSMIDQYVPNVDRAESIGLKIRTPLDTAIEKSWSFWKGASS